jgi:hypothetical protein
VSSWRNGIALYENAIRWVGLKVEDRFAGPNQHLKPFVEFPVFLHSPRADQKFVLAQFFKKSSLDNFSMMKSSATAAKVFERRRSSASRWRLVSSPGSFPASISLRETLDNIGEMAVNRLVAGSNPARGASIFNHLVE